jgi:hypothetical protein
MTIHTFGINPRVDEHIQILLAREMTKMWAQISIVGRDHLMTLS